MANKSIIDVDALNFLANNDSIFVNADGELKQISLSNLGSALEVVSMDLLWQNASPTSEFAAQTISVNLSGYTHYQVLFAVDNASYVDVIISTGIVPKNKLVHGVSGWGDTNGVGHRRASSITATSITFAGGAYKSTSSDKYMIPYQIYGIKGIQ